MYRSGTAVQQSHNMSLALLADHGYVQRQQSGPDPKKIHLDAELCDWKDDDSVVVNAEEDEVYK